MRTPLIVPVAAALLTLALLSGCGSSDTASSTSTIATTKTSTAPVTTPTTAATTTTASSADKACRYLTPADFAAAGVTAKVRVLDDASSRFNISGDLPSTACEYELANGGQSINIYDVVATGATAEAFRSAADDIDFGAPTLAGLGDQAVYVEKPDDFGGTHQQNTLLVRSGTTLVKISGLNTTFIDKAEMVAVARTLLTRL